MKTKHIVIALGLAIASPMLNAQSIDHPWSVIDRGGGRSTSNGVTLQSSIGQAAIQVSTSGGINLESGYIPGMRAFSGPNPSFGIGVESGWNMVSVPLSVADYQKSVLFPSATSNAFGYVGNYIPTSTLANGKGYWLKFSHAQTINMEGSPRTTDTLSVVTGWNLIGSLSSPVTVGSIVAEPEGIVTSPYFGYSGAYNVATSIEPGKAYWVRVSQNGKLILSVSP